LLNISGDPTPVGLDDIDVPVLNQFGEFDAMQPASFAAADAALYTSAPSVTTAIIPACGHILNGHINASVGWVQIDSWLTQKLPK
jgi:pimeloyl-ACP methyl ester carboxylesterase